jgi:hypothetical protein
MKRMIHWESEGERNAIRLIDVDPTVELFAEQPCVIRYRLQGTIRRHYPDLRVKRVQVDSLFEIKPQEDANLGEVSQRTELMMRDLPRFGFSYKLLVSEELASEPRLRNAQFLLRHGREELSLLEQEEVRRFLKGRTVLTWSEIREGRAGPLSERKACRLVLDGILSVDLTQAWTLPEAAVHVGPPASKGVIR